jgi:tRNA threonylcarbamoyladenosine biosynthesis protein TsaB
LRKWGKVRKADRMKLIALDSSGLVASAALLEDDTLIGEYNIQYKKTHSQTLLPMLDELCKMTELDLESVDAIAIASGPGSFTGLRIGSATAKGLGLALEKPIIEIPTLEGLACNLYGTDKLVCPIMDARRNQVYTGIYEFTAKEGTPVSYELRVLYPQCAVSLEEIAAKLNSLGREVIFLGDGVPVYGEKLAGLMDVPYGFAPAHMNRQRAASFIVLAADLYRKGRTVSAEAHAPEYLRLSQAEREKARKA